MRYLGIDLARSVAMIFVIVGHAMMGANVQSGGPLVDTLRLFLAVSPPVFFCLFGCMLQLVYARQYAAGQETEIIQRLLTRAVQCWALYVLTCAAMCLSSGLPFTYFVRCALFLGDTPFTDILKFYSAMLLVSPLLVAISVRTGLWPLLAACVAVQAAFPLISQIPALQGFPGAGTLSAFLYGGQYIGHTGPSVIHGLGFVVFGMLLGRVWQLRPGREFLLSGPGWVVRIGFLMLIAGAVVMSFAGGHDATESAVRIALRNTNHPLYLVLGCTAAVVFIETFSALRRLARIGPESFMLVFGRTSFFAFCFGSMLLYAVRLDDPSAPADPLRAIWSASAAIGLCVAYYAVREGEWVKSRHPAARVYRWLADDCIAQFVCWTTRPLLRRRNPDPSHSPAVGAAH